MMAFTCLARTVWSADGGEIPEVHVSGDTNIVEARKWTGQVVLNGHTLELAGGGQVVVEGNGVGKLRVKRSTVVVNGGALSGMFLANVDLRIEGGGLLVLEGGDLPLNEVEILLGPEARAVITFPNKDEKWVRETMSRVVKRDGRSGREDRDYQIEDLGGEGVRVTFKPELP